MKTKHIDTLTFQHSSLGCWESIVHLQKCLDFEMLKCCQWVNHIFSCSISGGSLHRSPLWYKSPFLPTAVNRENSTHLPSSSAHWALQHCTCPVSAEGFLPEYWRGSCSLLWGIFPTQGLNPGLPHCGWILHQLRHQGSPRILEWVAVSFSRGSSDPGIEPGSLALQADSSLAELPGKPLKFPREVQTRKCAHTHTLTLLSALLPVHPWLFLPCQAGHFQKLKPSQRLWPSQLLLSHPLGKKPLELKLLAFTRVPGLSCPPVPEDLGDALPPKLVKHRERDQGSLLLQWVLEKHESDFINEDSESRFPSKRCLQLIVWYTIRL